MTCLSMYPWTEEGESQRPSCMSRVVSAASCQWRSQVAEMRMQWPERCSLATGGTRDLRKVENVARVMTRPDAVAQRGASGRRAGGGLPARYSSMKANGSTERGFMWKPWVDVMIILWRSLEFLVQAVTEMDWLPSLDLVKVRAELGTGTSAEVTPGIEVSSPTRESVSQARARRALRAGSTDGFARAMQMSSREMRHRFGSFGIWGAVMRLRTSLAMSLGGSGALKKATKNLEVESAYLQRTLGCSPVILVVRGTAKVAQMAPCMLRMSGRARPGGMDSRKALTALEVESWYLLESESARRAAMACLV